MGSAGGKIHVGNVVMRIDHRKCSSFSLGQVNHRIAVTVSVIHNDIIDKCN